MYVFGERLRQLRKKANLTQEQLGEKLNVEKTTISKYENGTAFPTFDGLRSLSAIFNVSLDFLCGMEKPNNVSVFGLTSEQRDILIELAELFRERNYVSRDKLSAEQYEVLGKIVDTFRR